MYLFPGGEGRHPPSPPVAHLVASFMCWSVHLVLALWVWLGIYFSCFFIPSYEVLPSSEDENPDQKIREHDLQPEVGKCNLFLSPQSQFHN
jgi:hypothetical protein